MTWVAAILLIMILGLEVFFILLFAFVFNDFPVGTKQKLPGVSVLIAARNEEHTLSFCLESLLELDYPREKLEILIGNDASTDHTADIIHRYIQKHSFVKNVEITPDYKGLVAKSNVLAQLALRARNEHFAILDADMVVSRTWLKTMVYPIRYGYDMVSGYTQVTGTGWLSSLQSTDWMSTLHTIKVLSDHFKPPTVLGNNILITKKAYDRIGGFEKVGKSLVEDFSLLQRLLEKKYKAAQLITGEGMASTYALGSFRTWKDQRKRWISGALQQTPLKVFLLVIQRTFVALCVALMIADPVTGSLLLSAKLGTGWVKQAQVRWKTGQALPPLYYLFLPFFISLFDTFTLLNFIYRRPVSWKGRKL